MARGRQYHPTARALRALCARGSMRARHGLLQVLDLLRKLCIHPHSREHLLPCTKRAKVHRRQGNAHVSALTAEYPDSLASALAALLQPFCTQTGACKASISDFANLLCEPVIHRRPPVCDGAGFNSTADHTNPKASCVFRRLFFNWQHASQHNLFAHCASSGARGRLAPAYAPTAA